MREKDTKNLIESLGDYKFTITECAKSLDDYMQIVEYQDDEILTLKKRIAELEESCENMNEVEKNLRGKIKALDSNTTWLRRALVDSDNALREAEELNIGLRKANKQASLLNRKNFRKIRTLRSKLNNKLRGDC
ncbi:MULTISPECIES: hypothetical protein [Clostridium]|uniref:Uncharacterized protein n=1 Tax=Clostridium frigoriphilum TaxID=443253 RepID=A0ABU7UJR2_9CLOT|nr:hypothetical protein [Clostridium sp. DSM 17811]MBU3098353.1 hypothetical protein [Clostridium sp. DSM 17811]